MHLNINWDRVSVWGTGPPSAQDHANRVEYYKASPAHRPHNPVPAIIERLRSRRESLSSIVSITYASATAVTIEDTGRHICA